MSEKGKEDPESKIPSFSGSIAYVGIDSFNPVSKIKSVLSTRVNVCEASDGAVRRGIVISKNGFSTSLVINFSPDDDRFGFPYVFTYVHSDNRLEFRLTEFKKEQFDEKTRRITLHFRGDEYFQIELRFEYDFKSIQKFLVLKNEVRLRLQKKRSLSAFTRSVRSSIDYVPVTNDLVKNYSKKKKKENSLSVRRKKGGIRSLSSAGSFSASVAEKEEVQYLLKLINQHPQSWKMEVITWFQQIPYFDRDAEKLMSLYDYIEQVNLKSEFESFLDNADKPFADLEGEINRIQRIRKSGMEEIIPSIKILNNRNIFRRLVPHFKFLQIQEYSYNPCFYVVLFKHITHLVSSEAVKENPSLFDLELQEENVFIDKKHLWSVRTLRRKIAFNFLFGMSIEEYEFFLRQDFDKFREKHKLRFREGLERYNKRNGFILEHISLRTLINKRFNDAKLEWVSVKKELEDIENKIAKQEKQKENMVSGLSKVIEQSTESKQRDRYIKIKETSEKRFEKQIKDLRFLSNVFQKKKKSTFKKYQNANPTKIINNQERSQEEKLVFYNSETYESCIKKLINEKMRIVRGKRSKKQDQVSVQNVLEKSESLRIPNKNKGEENDIRLSSKLVLSRHQKKKIPYMEKFGMNIVKSILDPSFFKLGFIHGYVVVCNFCFHWFGSSLVYVSDLKKMTNMMSNYEDLVCFDTSVEIIWSNQKFMDFVTEISRLVIDWNTNYKYSFAGVRRFQSEYVRNCQEFALDILRKCLKVPYPFYPRITKYIDDLTMLRNKKILLRNESFDGEYSGEEEEEEEVEGETVKVFRYIRVTDDLPEEIRKGICKGKKRVYFATHKDLDLFVYDCLNVCIDLEVLFPGLYQLLKGFDRSFWVAKLYRTFPDGKNDPARIQGKIICHFYHPEKE